MKPVVRRRSRLWLVVALFVALLNVAGAGACAKSKAVEAWGGFYPVAYAPGVQAGIKAIIDGGRAFEPEGICLEQTFDSEKKERLVPHDFSHARGRLVSLERELAEPMAYRSYGQIDIKNISARPLSGVAFEGPFVGEFSVLLNGEAVLGRFEQKIPVGTLPVGATATVKFWTGSGSAGIDVGSQTRVTFSGGAAEIAYEADTRGPAQWLARRVSFWLSLNFAISLAIAAGVFSLLVFRRGRGNS
jgi:hypothetical protein